MKEMVATALADLHRKSGRLAVGALVATIVLEMMMQVGAPKMLGIEPMNPAGLITTILGLTDGHVFGTVVHFSLALLAFPIGYILFAYRFFPGPYLLRGVLWGVVLWLGAMIVIVPLAGMPIFFGFGKPMLAALVAHMVYGLLLSAIVGRPDGSS